MNTITKKYLVCVSMVSAIFYGCAVNKSLAKGSLGSVPHVYLVVQNCGPVQYLNASAGTAVITTAGLVAGLIGGVVDSIAYGGNAKIFNEKIGKWSFREEFNEKFSSELKGQLNWATLGIQPSLESREQKEFDEYIQYLRTGLLFPEGVNFPDRADEIKEKKIRKSEMDKKRLQLKQNGFDFLFVVNFEQFHFFDDYGKGEYQVVLTGRIYDIDKVGQVLWKRTVNASKDPKLASRYVQFKKEMALDGESIRNKFRQRGDYVIAEFLKALSP